MVVMGKFPSCGRLVIPRILYNLKSIFKHQGHSKLWAMLKVGCCIDYDTLSLVLRGCLHYEP